MSRIDDDDDEVVRDGQTVRQRMIFLDSYDADGRFVSGHAYADQHRPMSDAAMAAVRRPALVARDRMIERARNAWKRDAAEPSTHDPTPGPAERGGKTYPARAEAVEETQEAWRTPGGIAAQERALEDARDRIHQRQKDRLENAWRRRA